MNVLKKSLINSAPIVIPYVLLFLYFSSLEGYNEHKIAVFSFILPAIAYFVGFLNNNLTLEQGFNKVLSVVLSVLLAIVVWYGVGYAMMLKLGGLQDWSGLFPFFMSIFTLIVFCIHSVFNTYHFSRLTK